ncbi:unannotated protein [freshwater metagenome]|uniref:Unannotated protein n=1 Tax=freshwater metagenome TaxID=449393 RepID=A0A6J6NN77_9ZZZZ
MTVPLDAKPVEIGIADVGARHGDAPHIAVANHHFVAHDTERIVSIDHQQAHQNGTRAPQRDGPTLC